MQQKLTGTILFILLSFSITAQYDIKFYDDFSTNKNSWSIDDNADVRTAIKNGVYEIWHKRFTASYNFWREFAIDKKDEFYIETSIKHIDGVEDMGYGIVWGASSWSNSYNFLIAETGYYSIGGYKNKIWHDYKKWTSTNYLKKDSFNKLAIRYKSGKLEFYINDKKVTTLNYMPFMGNKIGFVLYHRMFIQIDYLKVEYNRERINLVKNINPNYKKKNLGKNINSKYSEIAPIISPDGKTLYVARQNHPQNIGAEKKYDVWYATRKKDGTWSSLKRMDAPINNDGDNLVISVSPDNNTLWLEGLYTSTGEFLSDAGISISHRTANGWSVPKQIVIQDFYNRNEYESYCPTVDRKVLIMSVERDDSYGEKDLYVSFRLPDGSYSKPMNMGTDLNTFFNEGTPFIASDNKTLYFYSYGHPGYGSADIFVSKRLDNSWRKWSKPQNLGPTINSNEWDTYYSIAAKGDYAYLVSAKNSYGAEDVFEIKMSEEAKPDPVVLLSGKVYDKKTKKPIRAKIIYEDLNTGAKLGEVKSNAKYGNYKIILPYGKRYGIRAEAIGYMAINEHIDLSKVSKYQEIKKYLYLVPIETGQTINLKNVQFKRSKAEFTQTSYPELNRLVQLMKQYPKMEIELSGHTDTRGKPDLLLKLSQKRVDAVKAYLVSHGINASRISGKGYGGTRPLGTGSEAIEIKNRRVEFKIKKM
ncbi:MAG: OmpA family protein [Bacteroidales bacterium]|nr:OmpA family protein [Bacteroidales bacterium]